MPRSLNVARAWSSFDVLARIGDEDGFEIITESSEGDVLWAARREDFFEYLQKATDRQLLNRIPGMGQACDKLATHEALTAGCTLSFWPSSWAYRGQQPHKLCASIFTALPPGAAVIVKPSKTSQGTGIVLATSQEELCQALLRIRRSLRESAKGELDLLRITDEAIIQLYVEPPLLLEGLKFDFRLYVFVCPADEERQSTERLGPAFLCREGLARFSTKPYEHPRDSKDTNMHLTNTSLSKLSDEFEATEDPDSGRHGSKRKLSAVLACLEQDGVLSSGSFWKSIEVLASTVLRRFSPVVYQKALAKETYTTPPIPNLDWQTCVGVAPSRFRQSFGLLGFDVLLNAQGQVFLLEVNAAPSLAIEDVVPIAGPRLSSGIGTKSLRKRWAVHHNAGVDFGQRCRCSDGFGPHRHELSPVDWSIKSKVVQGALQILQSRDRGDREHTWANGTEYTSLHDVPTVYL